MSGLKLEADTKRVSDVLGSNRFFRIPPYQRSYSWQDGDAVGLLNDLLDALQQGRQHFLGAIVVIATKRSEELDIVDGQQRLTTLSLIIAILRDLEEKPSRKKKMASLLADPKTARLRLTLNHVDNPFFDALIGESEDKTPEAESHELLKSNFNALYEELERTDTKTREKLQTHILNCPLIYVRVANRDEGYRVFRVLNARGRQPDAHDILKTELFERANLKPKEADELAKAWSEFEARLGAKNFDGVLRQIRVLNDPSARGDVVSGFCDSLLVKRDAKTFLKTTLPKYVAAYEELSEGTLKLSRDVPEVNHHIKLLKSLEHLGWRAPALKFLVETDRDADRARDFFADLERLGFAMQLTVTDRDARPKRYRKVCEDMASDKALFSRAGALSLTPDERQKLALRLTGRFGSVSQRRSLCLKINSVLKGGEYLDPSHDVTVEHILPRNVPEDTEWARHWDDLAERRELTDTLGNLCLLSKKNNQQADRLSFQDKRDHYFKHVDRGGKFALTRQVTSYPNWTPNIVRKRTVDLTDHLISAWKLDRPDG